MSATPAFTIVPGEDEGAVFLAYLAGFALRPDAGLAHFRHRALGDQPEDLNLTPEFPEGTDRRQRCVVRVHMHNVIYVYQ